MQPSPQVFPDGSPVDGFPVNGRAARANGMSHPRSTGGMPAAVTNGQPGKAHLALVPPPPPSRRTAAMPAWQGNPVPQGNPLPPRTLMGVAPAPNPQGAPPWGAPPRPSASFAAAPAPRPTTGTFVVPQRATAPQPFRAEPPYDLPPFPALDEAVERRAAERRRRSRTWKRRLAGATLAAAFGAGAWARPSIDSGWRTVALTNLPGGLTVGALVERLGGPKAPTLETPPHAAPAVVAPTPAPAVATAPGETPPPVAAAPEPASLPVVTPLPASASGPSEVHASGADARAVLTSTAGLGLSGLSKHGQSTHHGRAAHDKAAVRSSRHGGVMRLAMAGTAADAADEAAGPSRAPKSRADSDDSSFASAGRVADAPARSTAKAKAAPAPEPEEETSAASDDPLDALMGKAVHKGSRDAARPSRSSATARSGDASLDKLLKTAAPTRAAAADREPAEAPASDPAERPSLSRSEISSVMHDVQQKMSTCSASLGMGQTSTADLMITVSPDGAIKAVKLSGSLQGTPAGSCVLKTVKAAQFSPSRGLTFPYRLLVR